jgi:MFS family permease
MSRFPSNALGRLSATVTALRGDGRGWVLATVATGWLFVLGTRVILPALLPRVKAAFGLDNAMAGALVTGLWIAYATTQLPAGLLVDRIGERWTLVSSAFATAIGALVLTAAPTLAVFVVGCLLFGLGSGLYAPPRVTVLSRTFPELDGTALGVTFAVGNLGAAVLPLVAGALALRLGWRAGFGFVIAPLAVVGVALWMVVPAPSGATRTTAKLTRRAASRLGSAVFTRQMIHTWVAMTIVLFTYQGITAFLPTYLIEVKGMNAGVVATLYGLFYASGALSQSLAGNAADRYTNPTVLAALAGLGVFTLVPLPSLQSVPALAVLVVVLGTRLGIGPVGNGYVAAILPDDVQGAGYGLFRTLYLAVGAMGSVFVGVLANYGLFGESFLVLAGLTGVAALLFIKLPAIGE